MGEGHVFWVDPLLVNTGKPLAETFQNLLILQRPPYVYGYIFRDFA